MIDTVLHVIDSPLPHAGQIHSVLHGLLMGLLRCEVGGILLAIDDRDQIFVRDYTPAQKVGPWQSATWEDVVLRTDKITLVHYHGIERLTYRPLREWIRTHTKPYVISPYCKLLPNPWQRTGLLESIRNRLSGSRRFYHTARAIIASLPPEADHLQEKKMNKNVQLLHIGADPTASDTGDVKLTLPDRRCMLFLGPLDPMQGLVPLLKAGEDVVYQADEWHLVLAGTPHQKWLPMIRAAVERRNLTERVTFILDPDQHQQRKLIQHCELLIQPSLIPQPPFSIVSALACETPVVASVCCEMRSLAQNRAGWICEPKSASLVEVLRKALTSSSQELMEMGKRGHDWLCTHAVWDQLAPRFLKCYTSCS